MKGDKANTMIAVYLTRDTWAVGLVWEWGHTLATKVPRFVGTYVVTKYLDLWVRMWSFPHMHPQI